MEPESHAERIRRLDPDQLRRLKQELLSRKLFGNELIARTLGSLGLRRLYTVPGSPIDGVLKASNEIGIEVIGTRMQFGATVISGIDNFVTGHLVSAVCVSSGPAVTNCATGIHVAQANHRPLLVLGSRRGYPGEDGAFQHASFVEVFSPLTKWSAEVPTADDIHPMLLEAGRIAMEGHPGPVYLEFPEHVLEGRGFDGNGMPGVDKREDLRVTEPLSMGESVRLITEARRPLLCLSEDLRWGLDREALQSLVEKHQFPFITTPMGRGMLPDDHPLCFNTWRRRALRETDLLILIGGALDWRFRHGHDLVDSCKVIQAGLNADYLGMNRPTASLARLSPPDFVIGLGEALAEPVNGVSGWHELLVEFGKPRGQPFSSAYVNPAGFADPYRFLLGLRERLPEEAIVVIDGSICLSLANHALRASRPFSWFDPGLNGCIGAGIPHAIGAKLAAPDRPVVAIVGDTGFGMSGTELETAARYGIALKAILFNNGGVTGSHRDKKIFGGDSPRRIARFQPNVHHEQIVKGLGVDSKSSGDADTALKIFDSMLEADGPTCLTLEIDPDFPVPDIW